MKGLIQTYHKKWSKKSDGFFWNAIAGLVNAGEAVVLSMVLTRTRGIKDAGILSIAFAVGNLMMTIGKYGVRSYQTTDVEKRFTFSDYFWTRLVTVGMMLAVCVLYLLFCINVYGQDQKKSVIILEICLIYAVESVEDVFGGLYQFRQKLDFAAKGFIIRWMTILIVSIAFLYMGKSLQEALGAGVVVCVVTFAVYNMVMFHRFLEKIDRLHWESVKQVLLQCTPLFAVAFLSFYVANAPKYAIDKHLPQEVGARYGFLAMPVFVIGLLHGFLYQPSLVQMALDWREERIEDFWKKVRKQCVALAGLTILCLFGAGVCGISVLSAIYGTDLQGYEKEFLFLMLGGGMLAYVGYFCVVLTIIRRQKMILYGYVGAAFLEAGCMDMAVKGFGVAGAVALYTFLMGMLAGLFGVFLWKVKKLGHICNEV